MRRVYVASNIARNSLILWDTRRRRSPREQRGGAVSYGRYRTLQHRRFRRRRGREHRHDRRAECGPRPISRSAHRRSVRAGGGSVVGALAGLLRRRRASRRLSHAVARRARAALPASPRAVPARTSGASPRARSVRRGGRGGARYQARSSSAWRRRARGVCPRRARGAFGTRRPAAALRSLRELRVTEYFRLLGR